MKLTKNKYFARNLVAFVCLILFFACNSRPDGVLSSNQMTDILVDMQVLEATMDIKGISFVDKEQRDAYFRSVLEKYHVTQTAYDSSLVWYSKNPKKMEKIYIRVVDRITKLQKDVDAGKYKLYAGLDDLNKFSLWNLKTKYVLTPDTSRTRLDFFIPSQNFMLGDIYILKFKMKVGKRDSSTNRKILFKLNYENGKVKQVIKKINRPELLHYYTFKITATYPYKIKSISGQLIGCDSFKGKQDVVIDSIRLFQYFDPSKQDSLLKILQKTDPKYYPSFKVGESEGIKPHKHWWQFFKR